jgi:hypothetical protein
VAANRVWLRKRISGGCFGNATEGQQSWFSQLSKLDLYYLGITDFVAALICARMRIAAFHRCMVQISHSGMNYRKHTVSAFSLFFWPACFTRLWATNRGFEIDRGRFCDKKIDGDEILHATRCGLRCRPACKQLSFRKLFAFSNLVAFVCF